MRVLIGCEYSGVVRDAFLSKGHDAISCDLLPTDSPGPHFQGDVLELIGRESFDLAKPERRPLPGSMPPVSQPLRRPIDSGIAMTRRTCRPLGEHTFCGADIEFHGLHGGVSVCPVLSERGQWVDPESEEAK